MTCGGGVEMFEMVEVFEKFGEFKSIREFVNKLLIPLYSYTALSMISNE